MHHVHVFVCLTGPYKFVYLVLEQFKFDSLSKILSYWPLDVQHGTSWQRTLWDRGTGIQRFSKTGLTQNRPRKGRSKKLSHCAVRQVQKLASKNRCMSAASIALEVAEVEGQCQCSDHTPHTATSRFVWPSSQKEDSSEAGSQKSLQTVCWRQPGQEHELLEPCPVVWWV